jgi:hypothetical protein
VPLLEYPGRPRPERIWLTNACVPLLSDGAEFDGLAGGVLAAVVDCEAAAAA